MKKIILLLLFSCGVLFSFSQQGRMTKPDRDYKGYQIIPMAVFGGYGYDIVQGKQVLLHQRHNPFNGSMIGLKNREDAFKVAMWQIDNLELTAKHQLAQKKINGIEKLSPAWQQRLQGMNDGQRPQISSRVPMKVAQQLNIRLNSH